MQRSENKSNAMNSILKSHILYEPQHSFPTVRPITIKPFKINSSQPGNSTQIHFKHKLFQVSKNQLQYLQTSNSKVKQFLHRKTGHTSLRSRIQNPTPLLLGTRIYLSTKNSKVCLYQTSHEVIGFSSDSRISPKWEKTVEKK
jgi:hypothetical protein